MLRDNNKGRFMIGNDEFSMGGGSAQLRPVSPPREIILSGVVDQYTVTSIMCAIRDVNEFDEEMSRVYTENMNALLTGTVQVYSMNEEALPNELLSGNIGVAPVPYKVKPIILRIMTGGGSIDNGLALFDVIRESKTPVIALVHNAGSMGTIIALACDEIYGYKTSRFMVHDGAWGMRGKAQDHRDMMKEWDKMYVPILKNIYTAKSSLTAEQFDEIVESGKDKHYNAEEMLEMKFIDGIINYGTNIRGESILTESKIVNKSLALGLSVSDLTSEAVYQIEVEVVEVKEEEALAPVEVVEVKQEPKEGGAPKNKVKEAVEKAIQEELNN